MLSMDEMQQASVGARLKNRRTELGFSLADIAARTNIRRTYLEALEDGRYEALPGVTYQSGFLRSYAKVLGLEADSVLHLWRKETALADDGRRGEFSLEPQPLTEAMPSRRFRRASFILLLVILPTIAYYFSPDRRHETAVQVVAAPTQAPVQAGEALASARSADSPVAPAEAAAEAELVVAMTETSDSAASSMLPVIPAEGGIIRLEAMGPLALEVEVDSRPLQRYVLHTASALQWTVTHSVRLAVDNPAAAKIWFGGEPLDLAGRSAIHLQTATTQ